MAPTESAREENAASLHDEIAKLAYALWEARGGSEGSAEQDWLEAERRLQETQVSALLALWHFRHKIKRRELCSSRPTERVAGTLKSYA